MSEPAPAAPLRRSWLDDRHRAAGAKLVPFGGWDMPLSYTGVLEEHRACRTGAVVFDVSHLGTLHVEGPGALGALQALLTNDLGRIEPGRAQYTHLLDAADAHVVDDIIVWWRGPTDFLVMPNASNTVPALQAFATALAEAPEPFTVTDVTGDRVLLAVQGPAARERLAAVVPGAAAVERFAVATVAHAGAELTVGGTGYTGEDGVELSIPVAAAPALWDALLAAGVTPAGLGARDTLRLEMGYPLHGHELGPGITPLQAGLGWVVSWDKGPFRGRDALAAERERGIARRLRGLLLEGRQAPRDGYDVLVDGGPAGRVTSGNFSPTLERGIGLAFLPPGTKPGASVEVDVRGRRVPATVVAPPFVHAS
jgi:aminomethyltransferase